MRVLRTDDPGAFLDEAGPMLLDDEARHNLMLGVASTAAAHPSAYASFRGWIAEADGVPVGAASQTAPYNLVVARPRRRGVVEALATAIRDDGAAIPGVTGAVPEVDDVVDAWTALAAVRARLHMQQCIYRLRSVRRPAGVPGGARAAGEADRDLLRSWFVAFAHEAGVRDDPDGVERFLSLRLGSDRDAGARLWEDGEPVSLAGLGGRTPNGIRIGPVYTPPDRRRRGYASALVADLSAEMLARGLSFCFLYTDAANPTSNRIYADVGYGLVCESRDYTFEEPDAGADVRPSRAAVSTAGAAHRPAGRARTRPPPA
jgi:GNAT superfamily N-acetyltransferase